jgi:sec-independent protein translocase protein TatA
MGELFTPTHLIVLAVVAVVLFKGLGEGLKGFKDGMKGVTEDTKAEAAKPVSDAHTVTPQPTDATKPPTA